MKELFGVQSAGATSQELVDLQTALGFALPDAYLSFLRETNGAQWGIHDTGGDCLALWQTGEIVRMNQDYQIQRYLPNVLAIGSDGGDDAIVFSKVSLSPPNAWPVARVGFGALDADEITPLADSFVEWVTDEFRLTENNSRFPLFRRR